VREAMFRAPLKRPLRLLSMSVVGFFFKTALLQ
jgi:hypothetical protein